jgi:hypothetical protein
MAAHLENIAAELGRVGTGLEKATSLTAEADEHLGRSIEAGARGGFSAMVVNLRAAREQLGRVRSALNAVRSDLGSVTATVASAPKEIDASQLITLLAPLIEQVDTVRGRVQEASVQIPPIVQRIAASANQNPAIAILTTCTQQVLAPVVQLLAALGQTISAALAEAKGARTGER